MTADIKKLTDSIKFYYNVIPKGQGAYSVQYCKKNDTAWHLVSKEEDIEQLDYLIEGAIEHSKPDAIRVIIFKNKKTANTLDHVFGNNVSIGLIENNNIASNPISDNEIVENAENNDQQPKQNFLNGPGDFQNMLGQIEQKFESEKVAFQNTVMLTNKNQEIDRLNNTIDKTEKELLDAYTLNAELEAALVQFKNESVATSQKSDLMQGILGIATTFFTGEAPADLKGLKGTDIKEEDKTQVKFEELSDENSNTEVDTDVEVEKIKKFLLQLDPELRKLYITGLQYIERFKDKRLPILELKELFEQEDEYKQLRLDELIEKNS